MLDSSGHADTMLPSSIRKGFELMGPLPSSGVLQKKNTFATLTSEEVRANAASTRKAIWNSCKGSASDRVAQEVFRITKEERDCGWLEGPFYDDLPMDAILTRRFGVEQSSTRADGSVVTKVRPVDDYTESQVNHTDPLHDVGVGKTPARNVPKRGDSQGHGQARDGEDRHRSHVELPGVEPGQSQTRDRCQQAAYPQHPAFGGGQGTAGSSAQGSRELHHFHSTRKLTEKIQGDTLPFVLAVSMRGAAANRAFELLQLLEGSASLRVIGVRLRGERAQPSPMAQHLAKLLEQLEL